MTIRNRRGMPKNGAVKTLKDIAYKQTEVHGKVKYRCSYFESEIKWHLTVPCFSSHEFSS